MDVLADSLQLETVSLADKVHKQRVYNDIAQHTFYTTIPT